MFSFVNVIAQLKAPYDQFVGKKVSLPSGWWSKGVAHRGEALGDPSLCMVLEFMAQRQNGVGKKEDMFKVGLCRSEDPHFGRPNMAEDTDFWWVGLPKMSSAFHICTEKRAAETEASTTEIEASQ